MTKHTIIKDGFLDTVTTNKGTSLGGLAKRHKVLMLFLRHTNCVFCKESIEIMASNYGSLVKHNTIPVLVHMETPDYFKTFLTKFANGDKIIENMISVYDKDNSISKAFQIFDTSPSMKYMPLMVYRAMRSKYVGQTSPFAPQGLNNHRVPAVFLIKDGKVLNEFRYLHQADRADFLRVMIDPDNKGDNELLLVNRSELLCDDIYCEMPPPKKVKPEAEHINTGCHVGFKKPNKSEQVQISHEKLVLQDILDDPNKLRYFHLFAAKQYCPENLFFWQEVNFKYKPNEEEPDRKKVGQNICKVFFDTDSVYEINVKERSKHEVVERLEVVGPEIELFDGLVQEMESHILVHLFANFTESELYQEMISKTKK